GRVAHRRDERCGPAVESGSVEHQRPPVEHVVEAVGDGREPGGGLRVACHPRDGGGRDDPVAQPSTSMPRDPPRYASSWAGVTLTAPTLESGSLMMNFPDFVSKPDTTIQWAPS